MKKLFILDSSSGQLGNRLQTASYFLAAASKYNVVAVLCCFSGYENLLNRSKIKRKLIQAMIRVIKRLPRLRKLTKISLLTGKKEAPLILTDSNVENILENSSIVIVTGYYIYADPALLRSQSKEIIRLLNLKISQKDQDYIERIIEEREVTCVGIHIRHGDYAQYRDGEFFFPISHYEKLARSIVENSPSERIKFIVCSDSDISNNAFSGLEWTKGPGSILGDMYALSRCKYILGPFSTYNRWSAFWGNVPRLEITRYSENIRLRDFKIPLDLTFPEELQSSDFA